MFKILFNSDVTPYMFAVVVEREI